MKTSRLMILLFLMVIVPMVIVGWYTRGILLEQEATVENQFKALLQGRLDQIVQGLSGAFVNIEKPLIQDLARVKTSADLQDIPQQNPLALCGFWMSASGALLYPDSTQVLSQEESQFLIRTRRLWTDKAQLDMSGASESSAPSKVLDLSASRRKSEQHANALLRLASSREQGWIPWYWEDGLHLIFWRNGPEQSVVGLEVDRIALLSRIIGELPEKDPAGGVFLLRDENQRILHRFGGTSEEISPEALVMRSLPAPLQGWTLSYHGPGEHWAAVFQNSERLWIAIRSAILALILILVALWFWRESTRSLREARQRVDFVNQVSHELKTPLTNIRLYAELLEDELEDQGQLQKLRVIRSESERLSRMILNILTFSRRERRKLTLTKQSVHLEDLVQEVVANFSLSMEKRGMGVEVQGSANDLVSLDRDAAGQILSNLLSNAEKYAAVGKRVVISLSQNPSITEIAVQDFGPGIAKDQAQKIFEPFYRISHQLTEGVSGTGIGLSIARTLAQMMGGSLELKSSHQGACFVWRIPS